MRSLILTLTCLGLIAFSLPALAGPLTGAPAIKFEMVGPDTGEPAPGVWALGVGFTSFNFKLAVAGQETSATQTGAIVSAEYSKPLPNGRGVTFGGWVSPTGGDLDDLTMGEIHGRYSFTPHWGVEIGRLLFDAGAADGGLGTFMAHAVYQTETMTERPVKAQVGVGVLQGALDIPGTVKIGTGISLFANVSREFASNWSAYLSLWTLVQKLEWDVITGLGDSTFTTVQWSVGASRAF